MVAGDPVFLSPDHRVDPILSLYGQSGIFRRYEEETRPRLLKGRTPGPVFVTHRRPGPGKVVSPREVCPDTGLARLSYGQARAPLDEHTTLRGPGTGWDLHEYRHCALTHLGEQGASLLMLMAKPRPRSRRTPAVTSSRPPRRSPS